MGRGKDFKIKQSLRVRFLNAFRNIFRIPVFEKMLVSITVKYPHSVFSKFIPPDYLYGKNSFRMAEREGIKFKLDISNVVEHFIYFGLKDEAFESVTGYIKKSSVIFDIGANIGSTSLYFSKINPSATVYAFEPHPETQKKAMGNFSLNAFSSNIKLHNIGLGQQKSKLKLYEVNEHNPGMNRILASENNFPFQLISIETLDDFCDMNHVQKVDFIKIDVEGFEHAVLLGGEKTFRTLKPVLFLELDDNNLKENKSSAGEVIKALIDYGYTTIKRTDNNSLINPETDFKNCHYDILAK